MLVSAGAAVAGLGAFRLLRSLWVKPQPVFIARHQRYDGPLQKTIRDGLAAVGFDTAWVRGRRVLLKPNLVEPTREAPHMTTHPAVLVAVAQIFRDWGAEVTVGEAPGHVRDTEMALIESGVEPALRSERLPFADLNYSDVLEVTNRGQVSELKHFLFPREAAEADLIVSMPKLKSHHWTGITAGMKNLCGTLPGLIYGWPKNVIHYAGIGETVVDINASLPKTIAIVDGVLCMEGDGPIMGTPKPMGLIAVGQNLPALDATLARVIGLRPERVPYLALAAGRLGPIRDWQILQRGEPWQDVASAFEILDRPHLRDMQA
jgi:uncharacterized protein (DUF362 family)